MSEARDAPMVMALIVVLMPWGFRIWQSLCSSFAIERIGIRADQISETQATCEVPGFLGSPPDVPDLVLVEMHVVGGVVWAATGARLSFLVGMPIILVCLGFIQLIRDEVTGVSLAEDRLDVVGRTAR